MEGRKRAHVEPPPAHSSFPSSQRPAPRTPARPSPPPPPRPRPATAPAERIAARPAARPAGAAAPPVYGKTFDPWNSSATGHQRAEARGPEGWRESRTRKLRSQLVAGHGGGARVFEGSGGGLDDFDEKGRRTADECGGYAETAWADDDGAGARESREGKKETLLSPTTTMDLSTGQTTAAGLMTGGGLKGDQARSQRNAGDAAASNVNGNGSATTAVAASGDTTESPRKSRGGIFDGLVIYVNGSTHPLISDHKLKRLLAENGARMSIHLGRRQVTHVIIGRPAGGTHGAGAGAGGGLAGTKLEKEITRIGGCGVKYVGAEWVLESLRAGRRLPEAKFACLKVAPKRQQSVYHSFTRLQHTASGNPEGLRATLTPLDSGKKRCGRRHHAVPWNVLPWMVDFTKRGMMA